jgi:hypothetical protein
MIKIQNMTIKEVEKEFRRIDLKAYEYRVSTPYRIRIRNRYYNTCIKKLDALAVRLIALRQNNEIHNDVNP